MPTKTELRRTLLATRRAISPGQRTEWDARIGARVAAMAREKGWRTLAVYWPIHGEPDLQDAYREMAARGMALALPVVKQRDAGLSFVAWEPGEAMGTDAFGVAVPARTHVEAAPEAVLVPCVGFNCDRFRLGYGAGFYDRTLAGASRVQAIGVAYALALAEFDPAPHDIALDAVITETLTLPE
jgi:5-formyltetrahydrofolate cyclo-ligase